METNLIAWMMGGMIGVKFKEGLTIRVLCFNHLGVEPIGEGEDVVRNAINATDLFNRLEAVLECGDVEEGKRPILKARTEFGHPLIEVII